MNALDKKVNLIALFIIFIIHFNLEIIAFFFDIYKIWTNQSWPQFTMIIFFAGFPFTDPNWFILTIVSIPFITLPKTTCLP